MENTKYYLKQNVQIEPLVNQWHAYINLISPATGAMTTLNYQLSVMKSYLQMPFAHVAALKDPEMVGGPFIDYNGQRLDEIKELKERIENDFGSWIELAEAIKSLFFTLREKAKGYPLVELYEEIPEVLRGYVELVYDLEHNPSFRILEPLLYHGPLYREDAQSIALQLVESDDRPFIFSTPRLKSEDNIILPIKMVDERIDDLAVLKSEPLPYKEIIERFQIQEGDEVTLQKFLTEEAPNDGDTYKGDDVRVRYFGHACVLLESAEKTVLVDPLISYKYESELERYTFESLPEKIDYVVITHSHHDHVVLETLLQLRHRIGTIVVPRCGTGYLQDPSMKLMLKKIGFKSVVEIDDMETITDEGVSITGIPFYGEHCDLNIRSKSAYLVNLKGKRFLMAADSSSINPDVYTNVSKVTGDIDVLFVGLECTGAPMSWAYGSLFPEKISRNIDQARRSNGSDSHTALDLVNKFHPKHVYLYAMGSEPWLNYFMALQHGHSENSDRETNGLIAECTERGIVAEKLFVKKELILN